MSAPEKVLECLRRRGRAPTLEIVKDTGLSWTEVADALASLEGGGLVERAGLIDPTKPLSTTVWVLRLAKAPQALEGGIGIVAGLVLNPPLLRDLSRAPPASMGLIDSLNYIVQAASESLRIMMPYIGDLMSVLFTQHLESLRGLRSVRVIVEDDARNRQALEPLKLYLPNMQALYATRRSSGVKVAGAHAKLIIADEKVALVGTFNLTQAHLLVNYDVGLLVKGSVVSYLSEIYDALWGAIQSSEAQQ
jgi:phosphatidylserine/phosphatidylglycerophosphate/cardiolipin synthase-like enzyme